MTLESLILTCIAFNWHTEHLPSSVALYLRENQKAAGGDERSQRRHLWRMSAMQAGYDS